MEKKVDFDKNVRLVFPSPTVLKTMDIYETTWQLPKDRCQELPAYMELYGNPDENGRGLKTLSVNRCSFKHAYVCARLL